MKIEKGMKYKGKINKAIIEITDIFTEDQKERVAFQEIKNNKRVGKTFIIEKKHFEHLLLDRIK